MRHTLRTRPVITALLCALPVIGACAGDGPVAAEDSDDACEPVSITAGIETPRLPPSGESTSGPASTTDSLTVPTTVVCVIRR